MEQYFLPMNIKGKHTQKKVHDTNKRKKNDNQSDDLAEKKLKTAAAPNPKWLLMYQWLKFREVNNKNLMICTWCEDAKFTNLMANGTTVYKKEILDRHLKLKDHAIVEKKRNERSNMANDIVMGFAKQYDKDKEAIIRQMQCIYFAAKNHIALNTYPSICQLVTLQNQNITATPQVLALPKQLVDNTSSTRSKYGTYQNINSGKMLE